MSFAPGVEVFGRMVSQSSANMSSSAALMVILLRRIPDLLLSFMQDGMRTIPAVMQKSCFIASRLCIGVIQQFNKKPEANAWLVQIHQGFKNLFGLFLTAAQFRLEFVVFCFCFNKSIAIGIDRWICQCSFCFGFAFFQSCNFGL